jgi:hypothetical protein
MKWRMFFSEEKTQKTVHSALRMDPGHGRIREVADS